MVSAHLPGMAAPTATATATATASAAVNTTAAPSATASATATASASAASLGAGPSTARRRRSLVVGMALLATTALGAVLALGIGAVGVPVGSVLAVLGDHLGIGVPGASAIHSQIVWDLRLPRIIGAVAVGAGLAVCGAVLQCLTRNDLADPYLLGVSNGATVGAVTVIVLGVSVVGLAGDAAVGLAAFAGAFAAVFLVLVLATDRAGRLPPTRTVLAGVAVGQIAAAFTSFVILALGDRGAARGVLEWTLGSLAGFRWRSALIVAVIAVAAAAYFTSRARQLDAFAFGETSARALGVAVERTRWLLITATALVTACLVAYAGAIGFVGLVVPHVVRILCGPKHAVLLPLSALGGGLLMLVADTAARAVVPGQEIPVGVVTALMGAPVFAALLRRQSRAGRP